MSCEKPCLQQTVVILYYFLHYEVNIDISTKLIYTFLGHRPVSSPFNTNKNILETQMHNIKSQIERRGMGRMKITKQ